MGCVSSAHVTINKKNFVDPSACLPPRRLTYSHVYSYKNKYNPIGGNASNNLKKINVTTFRQIICLFS